MRRYILLSIALLLATVATVARAEESVATVLYDNTSAANTAQDTGKLDVRRFDCVSIYLVTNGDTTAAVSHEIYPDGATALAIDTATLITAQTRFVGSWGQGCSYAKNGLLGLAQALPPYIRLQVAQLGSTITGRLVIVGRKRL